MTTEQNQPPAPTSPQASQAPPPPGQTPGQTQGQTPGHRRRRRRRKGQKPQASANGPTGPNGQPGQVNGQVNLQAEGKPPNQARTQNSQQKPRQAGQGRFHQRNANPGNNVNGHSNGYSNGQGSGQGNGGGGRRKGKQQRRQQTFVGPMDHSYRAVNGNMADGPPSTMDYRGNGQNGYHVEPPPMEKLPAAIREDAPTKIFCFIEDLFFLAKIQETARKLGVKVGFVKGDKATLTLLTETAEEDRPSLIIFDLNNLNAKPLAMIPKLKAKLKRGTSVIGFLSHLQGDLKAKAIEAGCDTVMPRSAFSQNLPNLLRRHGLEEEVETAEAVY